ncbi:hypothetical protein DFR42_107118 [Undibacterium pigrum]|uniref:Uncharacterized protein n=1 Tax=Undibacterium pigrum TaxID=401470 RepID=A0A318J550_9BURK|nr:hypothetical protein DFR42_107118 [Undibacterium pigrum]
MYILGMAILLSGSAFLVLWHLYVTMNIFGYGIVQTLLCLLVPGYILLWALYHRLSWNFFVFYFSGIAWVLLGVVMLR